jgi:hypothetical protein
MNIDKTIFFIWAIWYFYTYGTPPFARYFVFRLHFFLDKFFTRYNKLMYPDIWEVYSDIDSDNEESNVNEDKTSEETKLLPKYEDKYVDIIRQLNKEWMFTKEEMEEKDNLTEDFYGSSLETIRDDMVEFQQQINYLKKAISEDTDTINYIENENEYGDELIEETTLEERNEYRKHQIQELNEKLELLKSKSNTEEGLNKLRIDAEKQAYDYIVNKKIEKLKNCYVIEKTPQGNVLMIYDKDKESFKYYSDTTIPYRYLEVVARKYVKLFNCAPLFVDMEEEIKLFEAKWTKEYELKKAKEAEEKIKVEEATKKNISVEHKKNVFAKFKSYNKEAGGKISMAAPPKNSIPNKPIVETKENEKILLKERANRYTYEGKFANFHFLQKIERKVFNKKLGISFADFKKMQNK